MKKEGFKRVWQDLKSRSVYFKRGNQKKGKEKKLEKVFGSSKKISTFAVPTETKGKTKKIKTAQCHRNIADTEVEATKFFKKTQSCKRDE